jgi:nucleolar protein 16
MGRERQKKKNRSSIPKIKPSLRGRTKQGKKKVNFLGNAVIAENWYLQTSFKSIFSLQDFG